MDPVNDTCNGLNIQFTTTKAADLCVACSLEVG